MYLLSLDGNGAFFGTKMFYLIFAYEHWVVYEIMHFMINIFFYSLVVFEM